MHSASAADAAAGSKPKLFETGFKCFPLKKFATTLNFTAAL
jgi:hypothetical protein